MKVVELKEELGERGEALSGNKAWLRRRLHAAIASEDLETALRAPPESRIEAKTHVVRVLSCIERAGGEARLSLWRELSDREQCERRREPDAVR
ncbi:hypothetical protein EMIHUDRAFT_218386 [Emiliania huxleyi CCMP1516]|uniref:SAP domain-containing protein n=2 Tax=Emiliania huxleyi TaxID=2903 RepID=A0A0D3I872_EMIH1|nr:hypothetical protein EMIHUDRAFT_218386 [Emiliania huxleyi CCMP1516]EOD07457.1 hypothetical protein EMIHUDRAFT_218386 [Emiliania huxleyi CCMP1516]|eukprot:XP_005759886.1 hypothetical protein EMIHUDRAFT_218386 [Emiliania huxleyi CCMP1516]